MPNTCKSNGSCLVVIRSKISGKRASNACLTCPEDGYNCRDVANSQYAHDGERKDLSLREGGASYQVVGGVMAYQAYDG